MKLRQALDNCRTKIRNFDTNSLRFKLWAYFFLFAVCLMAALWLLQTIFLQPYYQNMKKKEILRIAHALSTDYSQSEDFDLDDLIIEISTTAYKNDMWIFFQISDGSSSFLITPDMGSSSAFKKFPEAMDFMGIVAQMVTESPSGSIPIITKNDRMNYGLNIESEYRPNAVLCISTPLTPVESTINILASQLIIVTAASLFLACVLSLWISGRVTRPIFAITRKAGKLAVGEYSVTFDGGHYSEIQDLASTLTYTAAELAKADDLQKDLIANVSHDLRTPLTMVKSYAEMIRDLSGDNPQKRNAHLQVIIDEADRLNLLVNDLLLLSKMQSGVETMQVSRFDLKESVSSLLNTYAILEEQDGYRFRLLCQEETVMVEGDENRLKQVISNLLNNAVRYGEDGRDITVTLEPLRPGSGPAAAAAGPGAGAKGGSPSAVRVSVSDKGPGIPSEELEHIWDRYYKVSRTGTRAVSGGSGLGLSIVKEILTLHHARFGVESVVGQGSTFWFELPM